MDGAAFSGVQLANITMLSTLQEVGRRDPRIACLVFHVSELELSALMGLSFGEMIDLVREIGQACLFPPRADILSMVSQRQLVNRALAASKVHHSYGIRRP